MTQVRKVERPHGCIGGSIVIVFLVLCVLAVLLPRAFKLARYTSGVTLGCAIGETEVPPSQDKVVYIVTAQNCWTDWIEAPKGHFSITCDAAISEELLFTPGTTQVFRNSPGKQWPDLPLWTHLRFKNDSEAPIRITIQTKD